MTTRPIITDTAASGHPTHVPWNKARLIGRRPPLEVREVWAIRRRLQQHRSGRDLAPFNLAVDSTLRGCDLVERRVDDLATGGRRRPRTMVAGRRPAVRFGSR